MSDCFFQDRLVKAAKPHTCEACGHSIEVGELHLYQCGVFAGEFFRRRVHRFCWDIWKESIDFGLLGCFWETLEAWLSRHLGHAEVALAMGWDS